MAYREKLALHESDGTACFSNNAETAHIFTPAHWHEAYEILYIRRGSGTQKINEETVSLQTGDVVIIRPGDIHATSTQADAGCDVDVVQFLHGVVPDTVPVSELLLSGVCHFPELDSLFWELCHGQPRPFPGGLLCRNGLILVLIGRLLEKSTPGVKAECSGKMREVCRYLEQTQDLRLQQTAAHFGYSPEHLSRKFRSEMQTPYRDYCEELRTRRAVRLLAHTRLSVAAVGERLGYSDSGSFIRAFKRVYGITPYVYRKLHVPVARKPSDDISD